MTSRRATTTAALDRAVRRADRDADWQQYEADNKAANHAYDVRMRWLNQTPEAAAKGKRPASGQTTGN